MSKKLEKIKCISVCCAPSLFMLGVSSLLLAAQDWNVPNNDNTIAIITNGSIQTPYASIIELATGLLLSFAAIPVLQMAQNKERKQDSIEVTSNYTIVDNLLEQANNTRLKLSI